MTPWLTPTDAKETFFNTLGLVSRGGVHRSWAEGWAAFTWLLAAPPDRGRRGLSTVPCTGSEGGAVAMSAMWAAPASNGAQAATGTCVGGGARVVIGGRWEPRRRQMPGGGAGAEGGRENVAGKEGATETGRIGGG